MQPHLKTSVESSELNHPLLSALFALPSSILEGSGFASSPSHLIPHQWAFELLLISADEGKGREESERKYANHRSESQIVKCSCRFVRNSRPQEKNWTDDSLSPIELSSLFFTTGDCVIYFCPWCRREREEKTGKREGRKEERKKIQSSRVQGLFVYFHMSRTRREKEKEREREDWQTGLALAMLLIWIKGGEARKGSILQCRQLKLSLTTAQLYSWYLTEHHEWRKKVTEVTLMPSVVSDSLLARAWDDRQTHTEKRENKERPRGQYFFFFLFHCKANVSKTIRSRE